MDFICLSLNKGKRKYGKLETYEKLRKVIYQYTDYTELMSQVVIVCIIITYNIISHTFKCPFNFQDITNDCLLSLVYTE